MLSKHSPDDQKLIESLSMGVGTAFRSSIYRSSYVAANAHEFIDNEWINIVQLREFIKKTESLGSPPTPLPLESPPTRVKLENDASDAFPAAPLPVEQVKVRISHQGTHEILEILSDSEDSDEPAATSRGVTDAEGADHLIKNKDNDSWDGGTGSGDSKVMVMFEPGKPAIECRRRTKSHRIPSARAIPEMLRSK
ncbi:hypothetical protein B0H16DRAFT_1893879 [Mycena metata]|uniref:Uncharacterized protein n=1 Tax=Mycena metata TaxID=1033252 RepID=A0AAD7HXH0_9AGAR|nr:hypothetical protein B0H16DRAFT_1893879 [Mycena metata]